MKSVLMKSLQIILLSILLMPLFASGQDDSFKKLERLEGKAFIDAACLLPYDIIVANLGESEKTVYSALQFAEQLGYTKGEAECHAWLGVITYLQGRYDLSVGHNQRAINLYRELGIKDKEGHQYTLLGFQMKSRDLPRAIGLMRTGIDILEHEGDDGRLTGAYDNYGVLKMMAGELDSAVFYYQLALDLKTDFKDSLGIPYSLNKLGEAHMMRGDLAASRRMFDDAFRIRALRNDNFGLLENYGFYGDYFVTAGQLDSAQFWYHMAVNEGLRQGYPSIVQHSYLNLSKVYEAKGDPKRALEMHRNYAAVKDSLLNEQRIRQVTELELRFETAEKDRENLALREQRAAQALELSRQRLWLVVAAGFSLALLLFGLFLFQRNKQREAAKRDAAIIAEREAGLRAIIRATEEERGRIAKDLHDGIVQTLTGVKLNIGNAGNQHSPVSMKLLDEAISEVREISHRMMPRALEQVGLAPAIEDMLDKSLGRAGITYSMEVLGAADQRFGEQLEIGLYRICQELVNNIIKHSQAKHVAVQLIKSGEFLVLVVEDDGIGLPADALDRNGIGFSGMKSRASGMRGEMTLERGVQGGTVAMVRVPVL